MRLSIAILTSVFSISIASTANAQLNDITALMEEAVKTSPSQQITEADIARSTASAERLRANPYDYQLSASAGQRFIDDPLSDQSRYTEFGAGVSRTIRLPSKRRIDEQLAKIELDIANMAVEAARFDEKITFITLWNDWVRAEALVEISTAQVHKAQQLAELEQIKVDKGSGRQIDADLSIADAQMMRVEAQSDAMAAETAKLNLQNRYPALALPGRASDVSLPSGLEQPLSEQAWGQLPGYRLAILKSTKLRLQSQRRALYKRPDPTLGLDVTDEFGGRETSVMATISIPIGGKVQKAATREAQAQANTAELEARILLQKARRDYDVAVQKKSMAMTALFGAEKARSASLKALQRLEAGHAIGAVTLPDLIKARRAHGNAQRVYAQHLGSSKAAQYLKFAYETQ